MKTVSTDLATHLAGEVTSLARCFALTLTDGTVFRFTSHDDDLAVDGDTYRSTGGFSASQIATDASLAVDNLEVTGLLAGAGITIEDLRAGRFDYAEVRVFDVNWIDTSMGIVRLRRATLGEVAQSGKGFFRAELRGMTQKLNQQIVEMFGPDCLADLGDARCNNTEGGTVPGPVPIRPGLAERSTAYVVGEQVRAGNPVSLDPVAWAIVNPGAESGDMTGWTVGASEIIANPNASPVAGPHSGSWCFTYTNPIPVNSGPNLYAQQDVPAPAVQLDASDAGDLEATLTFWQVDRFVAGDAEMIVRFLDSAGAQLGSDQTSGLAHGFGAWTQRTVGPVAVPAGTRSVRLVQHYARGASPGTAIDDIVLSVQDTVTIRPDYGDVYLECTTAGTTAGSAPAFNLTDLATTTDGSVVWTAHNALLRAGQVIAATDRRTAIVSLTEPRAIDGWFALGGLTWTAGSNAGRTQEVKHWTQSTATIELYLPSPYAMEVGDRFEVYPGCDKRRDTCVDKFANIINFRGTPDIPGQDLLTSYPDAV